MKLSWAQRLNPAAWIILYVMRARNRRSNPTRGFPPARLTHAVVSVDRPASRSLHPSMPLRELDQLGPADWHEGDDALRRLHYKDLGVSIQLAHGKVASIEVLLDPERHALGAAQGFRAGRLELLRGGRRLAYFEPGASESVLKSILPATVYNDAQDDRRLQGYELDAIEVEAELDDRSRKVIAFTIRTIDNE